MRLSLHTLKTQVFKYVGLLAFFCSTGVLQSQSVEISPGNDTMLCTNQTLPLTAIVDPNSTAGGSQAFTGYNFQTIPLSAGPTTGTALTLADDQSSAAINIGFPFQFFGVPYNQLSVSSNGWVGFDGNLSGNYQPEPFPTCAGPNLGIMACWQDFNPGAGGTVRYTTTGVAPNRRFIVSWNAVPFWGGNCPGNTSTFQLQLYETTNVIEIHITNKPACNTLWGGGAVIGLVGANTAPACNCAYIENQYNNFFGAINNTAFRYTPIIGNLAGVTATLQSLQWSVNGANVPNATNPNYTAFMLNTTTNRTVVVTATFSIPCVGLVVVRDTVVISPRPYNPSFTVESPLCAGAETSTFTFTGSPTPTAAATIAWNFGGGTAVPGTGLGPHEVSWATAGTKTVSLTISGGACAAATMDTTVEVVSSSTATFTATPEVCGSAAATITYTGNATAGDNYNWNFDGGTAVPANGQGPFSVTWATPGLKTIRLSVGVGACVSAEFTQQVNVLPAPLSPFVVSSASVCQGSPVTVTFTGTSPASSVYTWNFAGGIANPATGQGPLEVTWDTPGVKQITLQINENGCISNTTTQNVTVNAIPTASFTANEGVCPGANATVTYTGTAAAGASFNWNWDSGTSVPGIGAGPHSVNWNTPGAKTIELTVTQNGCVSPTFNVPVTVYTIPTSTFTANPSGVCVGAGAIITYTGTASNAATYSWSLDGGTANPGGTTQGPHTVAWDSEGLKTMSLTVTENGCVSSVTNVDIDVFPTPSASFTATGAVCPGDPATITYTGSGSAAATFNWGFNGGVSVPAPAGAGPYEVSWNSSGNKTLTLVVTENGCASQPFNQTVEVYEVPLSTFTAVSPICAGESTTITYTGGNTAGLSYDWSFPGADQNASTQAGPLISTYQVAGTYFLNLTVTRNGCVSVPTQVQLVVNPIPSSDFNVETQICLDGLATVEYTGSAPSNSIFNWNFDSGLSSSNAGPGPILVRWETPGSKTISLSVNALGCTSDGSTEMPVEVLALPEVDAGVDIEVCSGALANLGGAFNPGYTYSWEPSAGLVDPLAAQTTAQLMNNTANTVVYEYVLVANDGNCSARDTMLYSVTAPPFVSFLSQPGQCFDGHSFSFQAVGDFTPTADFIWNFGPNSTIASSSVVNPANITFDTTGSHTISLQVNDGGCFSNLYSADVLIYREPLADFYAEFISGCSPLEVKFINLSEGPGNLIYEWNFGTGLPSASEQPSFNYTNPGIYDVSLVVSTIQGCSSSLDRKEYINVYPTPVADFNVSSLTANILEPEISFTSLASQADTVSYFIVSLDTTLYEEDVSFTFQDSAAEYNIIQYATNSFGCKDSTIRTIEIQEGYRFYIPNSFSPNNDGVNDIFMPQGEGIESFSIMIWNRWGQQLYTSYDTTNGWDGTTALSNKIVQLGTYIYKIETYDKLGFAHSYEGVVHVIQ